MCLNRNERRRRLGYPDTFSMADRDWPTTTESRRARKAHKKKVAQACAELDAKLAIKDHCECDDEGVLMLGMGMFYNPDTELPFVKHEPHQCKCTNDLKLFRRNGKVVTLCSCCNLTTDERL